MCITEGVDIENVDVGGSHEEVLDELHEHVRDEAKYIAYKKDLQKSPCARDPGRESRRQCRGCRLST